MRSGVTLFEAKTIMNNRIKQPCITPRKSLEEACPNESPDVLEQLVPRRSGFELYNIIIGITYR